MAEFMGLDIANMPEGYTPLAALVVVKVLDEEGKVAYVPRASDSLSSVEALGMAHYAVLALSKYMGEPEE
jgi:hypothetical protein